MSKPLAPDIIPRMRLLDVPWDNLSVGQRVSVSSPTDDMEGTIALLVAAPMIWIVWDDGNRAEYNRSILGHVTLLGKSTTPPIDVEQIRADLLVTDPEGE